MKIVCLLHLTHLTDYSQSSNFHHSLYVYSIVKTVMLCNAPWDGPNEHMELPVFTVVWCSYWTEEASSFLFFLDIVAGIGWSVRKTVTVLISSVSSEAFPFLSEVFTILFTLNQMFTLFTITYIYSSATVEAQEHQ